MPSRKHHQKTSIEFVRNKKKVIVSTIVIIIFILFLYFLKFSQFYNKIYTARLPGGSQITKIPKDKKIFSILLMGYGGGRHEGTYLTDSMMIIQIDMEKKQTIMISLPRDLWVRVPTNSGAEFHAKVNSVYQMALFPRTYPDLNNQYKSIQGAGDLVKLATTQVTRIPVDYYVAVDFEGFRKAVDILGGVTIPVARTFDDYEYPIDGKNHHRAIAVEPRDKHDLAPRQKLLGFLEAETMCRKKRGFFADRAAYYEPIP